MVALLQDLRHVVRRLRRSPRFAVAATTLAPRRAGRLDPMIALRHE
jgi:hypothetical protein